MGRPCADLDFTTDARPEEILAIVTPLASATWTTGIRFGTVGARIGTVPCEITTFRADVYDGVSRNPEVRFGDTLGESLTVEAALTGKREHIYHAAMLDPHTAAELDLQQIHDMVDDLIEAHGDYLPAYK